MFLRLCLLAWIPFVASAVTPREEISAKVPAARAILDAWQEKNPEKQERRLHVVLWTPADREPAPQYRERLTAILHDIRDFYSKEMTRIGFGPRTLKFVHATDGLIDIHLVKGTNPYSHYQTESGHEIRNECVPPLRAAGIDPEKETIVIFCNMSKWDPEKSTIFQNSPYYAGGTHRNGTAWQVDSPILNLDSLTKHEPKVRDGQYGHISIGRYNSIFIGGVCHELGHALGLPHDCARPDEAAEFGTALMGSGNRSYGEDRRGEGKGTFLTLASAFRLASHPIFCGSVKGIDVKANAVPADLAIREEGKGFVFTGKVSADPPVYGVVAYADPEGGGDYDATTATAVPDGAGKFEFHFPADALKPGKKGELRVVFLQANGVASGFLSATPYRYPYQVAADGKADISIAKTRLLLQPLVAAVNARDAAAARKLLESPDYKADPKVLEIGTRFAATLAPTAKTPVPADARTANLSDLPAAEEHTGYGRPVRDRLPIPDGLLSSGGRVYAHGFYAHAPAKHEWTLDGTWKSISGNAGLADGFEGSVKFVIEGDGKALWRSELIKEGDSQPFHVAIQGVKQLTLRTEDGGDTNRSDWALWLEPVLAR